MPTKHQASDMMEHLVKIDPELSAPWMASHSPGAAACRRCMSSWWSGRRSARQLRRPSAPPCNRESRCWTDARSRWAALQQLGAMQAVVYGQ